MLMKCNANISIPGAMQNANVMQMKCVGSPQVSFLTCTLEIPQKIAVQVFALNFVYLYF